MALLESIGVADAEVMIFAAGVASGALVAALALKGFGARTTPAKAMAARIDAVELRLAATQMKESTAVLLAAHAAIDSIPLIGPPRLAALVEMPKRTLAFLTERPDAQQVVTELFDALRANVEAAAEIGDTIVKDTNLNDPAERARIAARVKATAKRLDATFWDRYGELINASGFPDGLKAHFKTFFAGVKTLKAAVDKLPANPTVGDFAPVIERVVDLVETAIAIVEDLRAMS